MNFSSLNKAEVLDHFCPPHAFVTHELKLGLEIWLPKKWSAPLTFGN